MRCNLSWLVVLCVATLDPRAEAGDAPCPRSDAELALIFQARSSVSSPKLFADGLAGPGLRVPPGAFDLYLGIVSRLPPEAGVKGWTLLVHVDASLHLLFADTQDTAAAGVGEDPPGLLDNGFKRTQLLDPSTHGPGAASAVLLSFAAPVTLPPIGTATVLRLRLAGEDGAAGTVRVVASPAELEGGGGSLLPTTAATVGDETREFPCLPQLDVRFVDTGQSCATPPADAIDPVQTKSEVKFEFAANTYGNSLVLTPDGGVVVTGTQSSSTAYLLRADSAGGLVWQRDIRRSDQLLSASAVVAAPGGG